MLSKFSHTRTNTDNIKLGALTAFTAGMVNVASWILFFSFTSNITGTYAILAEEITNGAWFQVFVVSFWLGLFFFGSYLSNNIIINSKNIKNQIAHSIPLVLEFLCLIGVGIYGVFYYQESLLETEFLIATLTFAMGLQNGLTASISNFAVKTTHLTGLTTDLAIHFSLLTKRENRAKKEIKDKFKLLYSILLSYMTGAVIAGFITLKFQFQVFFYVSFTIIIIIFYDYLTTKFRRKL
jgi:uncharacterized membrane protein YoaK (UPF0700 family)